MLVKWNVREKMENEKAKKEMLDREEDNY